MLRGTAKRAAADTFRAESVVLEKEAADPINRGRIGIAMIKLSSPGISKGTRDPHRGDRLPVISTNPRTL